LSPEAPVPILKLSYTEQKDGMAFNVKNNLESFNIKVDILTNQEVITKERYIDIRTKSHLLRCDTGEINKLQPISAEKVKDVQFDSYDAVSIVDYNKGFIDKSIAEYISLQCYRHNVPLFVDSKKSDLSIFSNSIIKINALEASKVEHYPDNYELIMTDGENGAYYNNILHESEPVEVYDVCGAGDTFFAALIYKFILSRDLSLSIKYANKCARITVTKSGVYALNKEDVEYVNLC
tara:strand:+ start:310 stop:1017 length:708 start_codon:yes stop_codon:yes gene_type:complete